MLAMALLVLACMILEVAVLVVAQRLLGPVALGRLVDALTAINTAVVGFVFGSLRKHQRPSEEA